VKSWVPKGEEGGGRTRKKRDQSSAGPDQKVGFLQKNGGPPKGLRQCTEKKKSNKATAADHIWKQIIDGASNSARTGKTKKIVPCGKDAMGSRDKRRVIGTGWAQARNREKKRELLVGQNRMKHSCQRPRVGGRKPKCMKGKTVFPPECQSLKKGGGGKQQISQDHGFSQKKKRERKRETEKINFVSEKTRGKEKNSFT